MNIDDYKDGTQYFLLGRDQFRNESDYRAICEFLRLDRTSDCIKIPIDAERLRKYRSYYEIKD